MVSCSVHMPKHVIRHTGMYFSCFPQAGCICVLIWGLKTLLIFISWLNLGIASGLGKHYWPKKYVISRYCLRGKGKSKKPLKIVMAFEMVFLDDCWHPELIWYFCLNKLSFLFVCFSPKNCCSDQDCFFLHCVHEWIKNNTENPLVGWGEEGILCL